MALFRGAFPPTARVQMAFGVLHPEFEIPFIVRGSRLLQIAHVVSPNSEIGAGEKGKKF